MWSPIPRRKRSGVTRNDCLGAPFLILEEGISIARAVDVIRDDVQNRPREALQLAVPAAIYALQNAFLQWSAGNMPAALWQVTYQGKILVTAFFSVTLLRKQFKRAQWLAMAIMGAGIALVQLSSSEETSQKDMANAAEQQVITGLIMLLIACCCSGFASVFTEMVFKQVNSGSGNSPAKKKSVWLQNMQLALFSMVPIGVSALVEYGGLFYAKEETTSEVTRGLFTGFTAKTWIMAVNNAIGGLLVALVIKHADNILRGFSSSLATINASILSVPIFGFVLSVSFGLGTILVIGAALLYGSIFKLPGDWWNSEPGLCAAWSSQGQSKREPEKELPPQKLGVENEEEVEPLTEEANATKEQDA